MVLGLRLAQVMWRVLGAQLEAEVMAHVLEAALGMEVEALALLEASQAAMIGLELED